MMQNTKTRRGFVLIVTIMIMAVLTILLSVVTMQVLSQRRLVQQRQRQLQTQWLARAGVEIAAARLLDKAAGFSDENKDLLPDAKMHIVVEKSTDDVYAVTVEVVMQGELEAPVVRTMNARFRRTEKDGLIGLKAAP